MRRFKFSAARVFLAFLLFVYGCLFVAVHRMELSSASPHVKRVPNPFMERLPKESAALSNPLNASKEKQDSDTDDAPPDQLELAADQPYMDDAPSNETSLLFPIPLDWQSRLVEGRISYYYRDSTKDLWDYTDLPLWMKEYFAWHKEKRNELEKDHGGWDRVRYYVLECCKKYGRCGGTADRLGPLPFHVRMAAKYQRLLFISWRDDRPAPLEEFLLPPQGGIDWRMPDWLMDKFQHDLKYRRIATYMEKILRFGPPEMKRARWMRVKFQSHDHGQHVYDSQRVDAREPSFAQVYHDVWRIFFTPSPPIVQRIESELNALQLNPGHFRSVHVRALYAVEDRDEFLVRTWAQNAVNCATSQLPNIGGPILFVSDSIVAKEEAVRYGRQYGLPVVHRLSNQKRQPLHLEKDDFTSAEEFYDTFVDVLMMGLGQCTTYNMGGFGRWGSMISYNSSCSFHIKATMIHCDLNQEQPSNDVAKEFSNPLFLPAMGDERIVVDLEQVPEPKPSSTNETVIREDVGFNFSHLNYVLDDSIYQDPLIYEEYDSVKLGVNLWERSTKLPGWMKRYFKWHKKQRRNMLTPNNWKSMKLLIMECLQHQPKCGGTSDRLKPLPTLVRIAAATDRFLLIHWTRPSRLEEFLVPPKGGVNWMVPDWLHPHLIDYGEAVTLVDEVRDVSASNEFLSVRAKYQSYDGGQGWYDEQLKDNETAFNEVFHEVWRVFFTPSPPIAKRIKKEMVSKGLAPGEYASAHLRALYAQEVRSAGQTKIWTRNAVNCATKLRPGKPIFFASDSKIASDYSVAYGEEMNATVVTHASNPDPPLHLDKAENFSDPTIPRRPVSHYYDTFIDLYLLALGRCVFLSKGGYGQWGLLIGGNTSCAMRFKRGKGKITNPCNWTLPDDGVLTRRATLTQPLFVEPEW